MKLKSFVTAIFIVCSLSDVVKAQDGNNSIYLLPNLPQRVRLNPAYQPEYKVWVGLPALSGISVNYLNSSFGLDDLLVKGKNDSLFVDMDKLYKSLHKRNIVHFSNENSLLTVGVRIKKWYATLDVTQRNDLVFSTDKDLFTFLRKGNTPYLGKTADLGRLGLQVNLYDEFAFGLSKKINDKWTVGGRFKFLLGIANASLKKSRIKIESSSDASSLKLHSEQDIRISAPVTFDYVKDGDYINWDDFDADIDDFSTSMVLNTKNPGFALDLGAEYQYNEKWKFYASITDLGFIHWGAKNYRFIQNTTFDWQGADISNSINSNDPAHKDLDDVFDDLIDSLKDNFRLMEGEGAYNTMLRGRMYLGANYQFSKMVGFGGVAELTLMDKKFYPSLTASADVRLLRNVSAAVSYSIMPGNYVNLGAALTAKLGPAQLYVSTDNTLAANYTSTQSANLHFGINLLFGHQSKTKKRKEKTTAEPITVVPIKQPETVKKDTITKDTLVQTAKKETLVISPVREEAMADVEVATTKSFHVILGSFKNRKRAERLQERLRKAGFTESRIFTSEENMFRVSCCSLESREKAWAKVYEIRGKYPRYRDAWTLKAD